MDRKLTRSWHLCLSVTIAILLLASLSPAQLSTGNISGTVTDQSGPVMPAASVTIKNLETGTARSIVANEAGRYTADALPVGRYEVSVSLTGFQTVVHSGIELTVGRNAVVDVALQLGNVSDAVTVDGAISQVET